MARSLKERSVWVLSLALILGSFVFLITSPELVSMALAPSGKFSRGDVVQTENTVWSIEEYLDYHASPKYRVIDLRDGRESILDADWVDRVGRRVEAEESR